MRILRYAALLTALSLMFCGCGLGDEVESRAYVLALGVDRADEGGIELTVRVPKIGKPDSAEKEGGSDSPYLTFSASGETLRQALENVQWLVPRVLNLSHLKLLVVSEQLAAEADFRSVLNAVVELRHLYTAANMVVSAGKARELVEALELVIDARLSNELTMAFRALEKQGDIPETSLAEVYFAANSIYGDPVVPMGFVASYGDSDAKAAFSLLSPDPDLAPGAAQGAVHLLGGAVLRDGRLALRLDGKETLALNLINRGAQAISFASEGKTYQLVSSGYPEKSVSFRGDRVELKLCLSLNTLDAIDDAALRAIEAALGRQILDVITACQRAGVDPFGFSEKAARCFYSVQDWLDFDWRSRLSAADASVQVKVSRQ